MPTNDPVYWAEFETAFEATFTDIHEKTKATSQLHELCMGNQGLDNYIANFRRLANLAGYNLDASSTMDQFL